MVQHELEQADPAASSWLSLIIHGNKRKPASTLTSSHRPAASRAGSPSADVPPPPPPPPPPCPLCMPASVRCRSVHSDSRGIAMSPMSYIYTRPSLPPSAARRPSLLSHFSLLIARVALTCVDTAGTYKTTLSKYMKANITILASVFLQP